MSLDFFLFVSLLCWFDYYFFFLNFQPRNLTTAFAGAILRNSAFSGAIWGSKERGRTLPKTLPRGAGCGSPLPASLPEDRGARTPVCVPPHPHPRLLPPGAIPAVPSLGQIQQQRSPEGTVMGGGGGGEMLKLAGRVRVPPAPGLHLPSFRRVQAPEISEQARLQLWKGLLRIKDVLR